MGHRSVHVFRSPWHQVAANGISPPSTLLDGTSGQGEAGRDATQAAALVSSEGPGISGHTFLLQRDGTSIDGPWCASRASEYRGDGAAEGNKRDGGAHCDSQVCRCRVEEVLLAESVAGAHEVRRGLEAKRRSGALRSE